jgi:hypothetical protein
MYVMLVIYCTKLRFALLYIYIYIYHIPNRMDSSGVHPVPPGHEQQPDESGDAYQRILKGIVQKTRNVPHPVEITEGATQEAFMK